MFRHLVLFINSAEFFLTHRQNLARAALDQGLRVTIICPAGPAVEEIRSAGYICEPVILARRALNPLFEIWSLASLWFTLRRLKPDVLHSFAIKPVLYGSLVGRLLHIPLVVNTLTGLDNAFGEDGIKAGLLRWVLSVACKLSIQSKQVRFIFQNQDDLEFYVRRGWVKPGTTQVIPDTGVDTRKFIPPLTEPELPVRILFAGRFLKDKGLPELVQACDRLHAEEIPFRLILCGRLDPGNPGDIGWEKLREIEARPFVHNFGYRQDMTAVYLQTHIVCLPSCREGLPLVLIEAASCGRPLVTTDVTGCRDVVKEGQNGFLAEARSVADLYKALRTLILDEGLRSRLGRRSREMAMARFEKSVLVEEGLRVYDETASAA